MNHNVYIENQPAPVVAFSLTSKDISDLVDAGNLGNAIGEVAMNDKVAIAIVETLREEIAVMVADYAEDIILRLADAHARIALTPPS